MNNGKKNNLFDWLYEIMKNFTGSTGFQNAGVGRIIGVTALTAFSYKKRYGRFTSTRKSDRNNETTMLRS